MRGHLSGLAKHRHQSTPTAELSFCGTCLENQDFLQNHEKVVEAERSGQQEGAGSVITTYMVSEAT